MTEPVFFRRVTDDEWLSFTPDGAIIETDDTMLAAMQVGDLLSLEVGEHGDYIGLIRLTREQAAALGRWLVEVSK